MKPRPLNILFADKNPGPARRIRVELRHRGAHVLLATSSDEAIHQAALAAPDLVIMDDDLKSDGQIDLGSFIRDAFPNAGIILLRGNSPPTSSAGGLDLLLWGRKPIADRTLLEVLECTFPGRLGKPTASWSVPRQIGCVDEEHFPVEERLSPWTPTWYPFPGRLYPGPAIRSTEHHGIPRRLLMNKEQLEGKWTHLMGRIQAKWSKLTPDDAAMIDGRRDQLHGKLHELYGISQEIAERELADLETGGA